MTQEDQRESLEKGLIELVQSAFRLGGAAYLREIENLVAREAQRLRKEERAAFPVEEIRPEDVFRERYAEIIGDAPGMLRVFSLVDKVAPASIPVLIQGESGTGKELIARAIHRNSPRKDLAYIAENCAAIPETLLESELFGYKKGAFTGAERNKDGLFVAADRGTLFLDEIGDMSLNMQKKLLRVLQDGEVRPVGGNRVIHVDVRLLSASNQNLQEMVSRKLFREDRYYRLNTITLELPPLRERREDIPELTRYFLKRVAKEMNIKKPSFSDRAMKALQKYRWPGNIRELENEIRRCLALSGGQPVIDLENLSEEVKN